MKPKKPKSSREKEQAEPRSIGLMTLVFEVFIFFLVLHTLSISQHIKVLVFAGVLSYTKQSIREARREKIPRGSLRYLLASKGETLTTLFKFCQVLKGIPLHVSSISLIIKRGSV